MASHRRPSSRDGFELAILCAVNVEVSAVESLFDEDWESERPYGKAPGDPNSYKIGRIANCNVVLAYLPEMGNNSAARTALWLKTSFTNISLALLVGICGGVPSSTEGNDILLGDVVISTRIVQYDLGRLHPNAFAPKNGTESNLLGPPPRIRSFLAKLQAGETRKTLQENTYQNLLDISLIQSVAFPGIAEDKLYAPSYRHKHQRTQDCDICASCSSENDAVCNTALHASCSALGCSSDQLICRDRIESAAPHEGQLSKPRIHFGKMASGNFVVRSSLHRDKIAAEEGIIAFEMEGVAVWEELPTIIVKSVCDYADSHKNKDWQKYAASVAAACSKAVINECRASYEGTIWPPFQPAIGGLNEFTIPSADLRLAVEAKEAGTPSFWSHKMYRDSAGNTVDVQYSTDIVKSEELARTLVDEPILGFGMHWLEPEASIIPSGESAVGLYERYNISLVVLAKEDSICIFHIALHNGDNAEQKIAPTLRKILESPDTLKSGVLIFQFKDERLLARFGIRLKGIFELADLDNILDYKGNSAPKRELAKHYVAINDLVEEHLHLDHYRGKNMRLSNWSRCPLHETQISYAATDAYAGYQLFRVMDTKRLRMRPVPPLPLPTEQQTVEQINAKEIYQPSFLRKRRAQNTTPEPSSSSQSSSSQTATQEGSVEGEESPTKRRRNNSQTTPRKSLYPDAIDPNAKFVWRDDKPVFNFGKHWNCSLQDVAKRDRSYLGWLTNPNQNFSSHVVKIARDALNGVFPTRPQSLPFRGAG